MTISRAVDDWLGELERQGKLERTVDTYRRLLYKLIDEYPHTDVHEVSPAMVRRFLDGQARKKDGSRKAPASIAQNVTILNTFMDWLEAEGVIARNPTRRNGARVIARPKLVPADENDNVKTVTTADVMRLIEAAKTMSWKHRIALHVLIGVGPRRKGAALIRLRDFDPEEGTITFREKGAKTITKPIPAELHSVILGAIAAAVYESEDDYLIPNRGATLRKDGQRNEKFRDADADRDDRIVWHLVRDIADEAGVDTHVHALRAAFAVHFLEHKPGEIMALKNLLGHRRLETTLVYLRRLNRMQAMETVRDVSWGTTDSSQNADESMESYRVTEKEGFEPSILTQALLERAGRKHGDGVPGEKR